MGVPLLKVLFRVTSVDISSHCVAFVEKKGPNWLRFVI